MLLDLGILEAYLTDASGAAPGSAAGLVRLPGEAAAAAWLRQTATRGLKVQIQAARSSLTGGAVPQGEVVLSVEPMQERGPVIDRRGLGRVTVQPGMRLCDLQRSLAVEGFFYPPVPTYQQAMIGGTVSTNAGGAATFKYGVTRNWVHGLRVLLFNGDLLVLERGQYVARRGESFTIALTDGRKLTVPVPDYRLPDVKKVSAGYHAADPLDLIDLFIGSEGTLGLITAITVNLRPLPPAVVTGLAAVTDPKLALLLAAALRDAAERAREAQDPRGPDIRAIEWLDDRSLEILREHDEPRRLRVELAPDACGAVLFELELPEPTSSDDVLATLAGYVERRETLEDYPLTRLASILEDHGALDSLQFALADDPQRQQALTGLREAVPTRVSEILSRRRAESPGVEKVGGDLIVPLGELPGMIQLFRSSFERRGLEYAVWGHLSDGNLHPNALPRNAGEVRSGFEALLEFADEAARRGGCPLSEHGVGRSPIKQQILRRFLGEPAIEQMRRIKLALDPDARFAPGVLFPL